MAEVLIPTEDNEQQQPAVMAVAPHSGAIPPNVSSPIIDLRGRDSVRPKTDAAIPAPVIQMPKMSMPQSPVVGGSTSLIPTAPLGYDDWLGQQRQQQADQAERQSLQKEFEDKLNPGAVISAKLMSKTENVNNPVLRAGLKVLSSLPGAFGDAVYRANPEMAEQQAKVISLPGDYASQQLGLGEQQARTRLQNAQAQDVDAQGRLREMEASGGAQKNWKPVEGSTAYDSSSGQPTQQLFRNEITGAEEWRPVPSPLSNAPQGGAAPVVGPGQSAPQQAVPRATPQATAPQGGGGSTASSASSAPTSGVTFVKPTGSNAPVPNGMVDQINKQAADLYRMANPKAKDIPSEWQLPYGATDKQLEDFKSMLQNNVSTEGNIEQREFNQDTRKQQLQMQQQMQLLNEQFKTAQLSLENAKSAVGTDPKTGQRVAGSFGDLKDGHYKNVTVDPNAVNDRSYMNLSLMVHRTKQYLEDLSQTPDSDLDKLNRLFADVHANLGLGAGGLLTGGPSVGGSIGGEYLNKILNNTIYKNLSPAGKRLANDYYGLGESAITYLTSIQQVKGMRGQQFVNKIENAWMTPEKDRATNVDAARKFVSALQQAEHQTPMQLSGDDPIDWTGLK